MSQVPWALCRAAFMRRLELIVLVTILANKSAFGQAARADQFYYPGAFNWALLETYPEAARLFNAFDYGHAVLYERMYVNGSDLPAQLERDYRFLTTDLLVHPPRFAVAEEVIAPSYGKAVWRALKMFQWAHTLHRQVYDVYASERLPGVEKDTLIERLTDYYLSNRNLAFTAIPKAMGLMEDQAYSKTFRTGFPAFNGLIWAYHWLQVGLYEALLEGSPDRKRDGVRSTIARFWEMVRSPEVAPSIMPMTSAVAPLFAKRHPRAAIVFDNLHMMHDIISDILAATAIPKPKKAAAIEAALAEFRDGSRNVMPMDEWWRMGELMGGVEHMGGKPPHALK